MKLKGINPVGDGEIVEVHADLYRTDLAFNMWLQSLGFEDDPFTVFHPKGYKHHMTGRVRSSKERLPATIRGIDSLTSRVIREAQSHGLALYLEIELVREVTHFSAAPSTPLTMLNSLQFFSLGQFGGAKADIHVEFPQNSVTEDVRRYFVEKKFYWVATPPTFYFPAEEIATLQTTTYESARDVYERLAGNPPPGCTAVHLEQKLHMLATSDDLPMPEAILVKA